MRMIEPQQKSIWHTSSRTGPTALDTHVSSTGALASASTSRRPWQSNSQQQHYRRHRNYSHLGLYLLWVILWTLHPPSPPFVLPFFGSSSPTTTGRPSSTLLLAVQAQAPPPVPLPQITIGAASTRTPTQFLILGGLSILNNNITGGQVVRQFFYLNLTAQWTVTNPTWAPLGSGDGPDTSIDPNVGIGGPALVYPAMAVYENGTYLNTFGGRVGKAFSYRYTFATGLWTVSQAQVPSPTQTLVMAAQDPLTQWVYFAGGYDKEGTVDGNMTVYNFEKDTISNVLIPDTIPTGAVFPILTDRQYYSVVYSPHLACFLYFGGFSINNKTSPNPGVLTRYVPKTNTWDVPAVKGGGPAHRTNLCMAANDDGTKIVVFAGYLDGSVPSKDLWILDVTNWTWTQAQDYTQPRVFHVCTISNNTLISWGGWNGQFPEPNNIVLFNLQTMKYEEEYMPPGGQLTPQPPGTPGGGPTDGGDQGQEGMSPMSPKKQAEIIGGSTAGLAVLMVIAGACLYICRQNRARRRKMKMLTQGEGYDEKGGGGGGGGTETRPSRLYDDVSRLSSSSLSATLRESEDHHQPSRFGLSSTIRKIFYRSTDDPNMELTPMKDAFFKPEEKPRKRMARVSDSQQSLVIKMNLKEEHQQELQLLEQRVREQQELIQFQQQTLDSSLLREPQLVPLGASTLLDPNRLVNPGSIMSSSSSSSTLGLSSNQLPTAPEQRLQRRLQNIHPSLFVPLAMTIPNVLQGPQFSPIHIVSEIPPILQQLRPQHHQSSVHQLSQQQQLLHEQQQQQQQQPQHSRMIQQQQNLLEMQMEELQLRQQLDQLEMLEWQNQQELQQRQQQQQPRRPMINYKTRPTGQGPA